MTTCVDMPAKPAPVMDLSKIDFAALAAKFKESKHQKPASSSRTSRSLRFNCQHAASRAAAQADKAACKTG